LIGFISEDDVIVPPSFQTIPEGISKQTYNHHFENYNHADFIM